MKPHEETWERLNTGHGWNHIWNGTKSIARDAPTEHARLIAAAPEMARALLENGYIRNMGDGLWHTDVCNELNDGSAHCGDMCGRARAALKKAGVLP